MSGQNDIDQLASEIKAIQDRLSGLERMIRDLRQPTSLAIGSAMANEVGKLAASGNASIGGNLTVTNNAIVGGDLTVTHDIHAVNATRVRVQRSTDQTIPTATWTPQSFDIVTFESNPSGASSQWSASYPTRLTSVVTGVYLVIAHTRFYYNSTGSRGINITKNGVSMVANLQQASTTASDNPHLQVIEIIFLAVGDYIETNVYQNSGGNLNTNSGSNNLYLEWMLLG